MLEAALVPWLCLEGERGLPSMQTAPQPGCMACPVPKFQAFLCVFLLMGRKLVCVGQIKVTLWYNPILGQDNQRPRPRDIQWDVPTAQLNRHLVAVLTASGGNEALDVICRNQAAPVVLTSLLFSAARAY